MDVYETLGLGEGTLKYQARYITRYIRYIIYSIYEVI